jgi:hypothetical protein
MRIGAAWCRLFTSAEPGYGFIDEATPELSIGVVEGDRGRGVGDALLAALLERVAAEGGAAVSLSVEPGNARAVRLYERHGFVALAGAGGALTMRRDLTRAGSGDTPGTRIVEGMQEAVRWAHGEEIQVRKARVTRELTKVNGEWTVGYYRRRSWRRGRMGRSPRPGR